jgi:hypothetical protein
MRPLGYDFSVMTHVMQMRSGLLQSVLRLFSPFDKFPARHI